jgi:hypothetical protein
VKLGCLGSLQIPTASVAVSVPASWLQSERVEYVGQVGAPARGEQRSEGARRGTRVAPPQGREEFGGQSQLGEIDALFLVEVAADPPAGRPLEPAWLAFGGEQAKRERVFEADVVELGGGRPRDGHIPVVQCPPENGICVPLRCHEHMFA